MKTETRHRLFIYGLGLLLTGVTACSWQLNYQLDHINFPQLISSSIEDKEMRLWTVVDFGVMQWDNVKNEPNGYWLAWEKLVVCYDPTAQFWIFNDFCTNTMDRGLEQTMYWSVYNARKSRIESLEGLPLILKAQFENACKTPLFRFNQTNVFDVVAFRKDLPDCPALFLMCDKRREHKASFKQYRFDQENAIYNTDIRLAFLNSHFSVLLSTDDYAELVDYMKKHNEIQKQE